MAIYKWVIVDDVIIGLGTDGQLPDDVWRSFVHELASKPVRKYLSVTPGTLEVTSVQRKLGIDVVRAKKIRVASVTDSALVRGIITAASWFNIDIKAFPTRDMQDALRFLDIPSQKEAAIMAALERLRSNPR